MQTSSPNYTRPKPRTPTSQVQQPKKRFPTLSQEVNIDVRQCIQRIVTKIQNSKMQTLHPPFFQKTLTKFRQESFSLKLRPQILHKLSSQSDAQLTDGLKTLLQFITAFDQEYIDVYCEQIREPYIRKIFNEGYEIDKVNFKKLNSEYELRTFLFNEGSEIQEVLNQTSEFLIQLEVIEDLLARVGLYFGISCDKIMEKLKEQGAENRKGTWAGYFSSLLKRTSSYALRKGSRVVQNTGYASMLSPAFAMLTWAIIGGSSTLPWQGGVDIKALLIPLVAFTVPYMLQSMAETIERSDFKVMLESWAEQFESINNNLRRFSELLQNQIVYCAKAKSIQDYMIHFTSNFLLNEKDLTKYVHNLCKRVDEVSNFDEATFQQMQQRTKAYYIKYVEVEDDEWTAVMTQEQYEKYVKSKKNGEEKDEEKKEAKLEEKNINEEKWDKKP